MTEQYIDRKGTPHPVEHFTLPLDPEEQRRLLRELTDRLTA